MNALAGQAGPGSRRGRWLMPEALLVPLLFAFVGLRLVQDIAANSLWTDEFFTVSFAYLSPDVPIRWAPLLPEGPIRWVGVLSTAFEPHFPTHYAVTRLLSSAIHVEGMGIEHFARLPSVIMVLAALAAVPAVALRRRADALSWLFAAVVLVGLVGDPHWREHANEARTYGLMAALGVAMVAALGFGAAAPAAGLGLLLVLMHPFGLFVGLAPAAAILMRRGGDLSRRGFRAFLLALGLVLAVTLAWLVLKFGLRPLATGAAAAARPAGAELLRALDPWIVAASALALGGAVLVQRRRPGPWPLAIPAFLVMAASIAVFAALLFVAPVQAYPRYVTWLNPVLWAATAACVVVMLGPASGHAIRAGTAAAGLFIIVAAAGAGFGPPWGNDLRGAARHVSAIADANLALAQDSAEVLDLPPWFRTGLACFRAGQMVAYLSEAARHRVLCERDGVVTVPDGVDRVVVVREPIAWIGARRLALDGFAMTGTRAFGAATIEIHERRGPADGRAARTE